MICVVQWTIIINKTINAILASALATASAFAFMAFQFLPEETTSLLEQCNTHQEAVMTMNSHQHSVAAHLQLTLLHFEKCLQSCAWHQEQSHNVYVCMHQQSAHIAGSSTGAAPEQLRSYTEPRSTRQPKREKRAPAECHTSIPDHI